MGIEESRLGFVVYIGLAEYVRAIDEKMFFNRLEVVEESARGRVVSVAKDDEVDQEDHVPDIIDVFLNQFDHSKHKLAIGQLASQGGTLHIEMVIHDDMFLGLLQNTSQLQDILVQVQPIFPHVDHCVIDYEVDIPDNIAAQICNDCLLGLTGLQLLEHELSQQQFVQFIEFMRSALDLFAIESDDDGVADHVDDVFAVFLAADPEVGLQNEAVVVVLQQPFLLFGVEIEAKPDC